MRHSDEWKHSAEYENKALHDYEFIYLLFDTRVPNWEFNGIVNFGKQNKLFFDLKNCDLQVIPS